ncbi:MAG TPA: glycosyltransferase family 39 protein [Acidisarcina sp.]
MSVSSSPEHPARTNSSRLRGGPCSLIVGALLLITAGQLYLSARQESQTFDEGSHLFAGYEYLKHGDFGRNPEHPPLAKLVAALSLLPLNPSEPAAVPIPYFKAQDFINGAQFLYGPGPGADTLLGRGRTMVALFTLVLAMLVFVAGSEMFGREAGLLALLLTAFEPNILANGVLITTDVPLTCLFFLSIYSFYRFSKRPTPGRLAVCAIAVGLTLAAKHSGIFVLPMVAVLAICEALRGSTADVEGRSLLPSSPRRALLLLASVFVIAIVGYTILWAFYGFRYAARPGSLQLIPSAAQYMAAVPSGTERALLGFFARHHLFPEAYLYGWADILQIPGTRSTFLFGRLYSTAQWFFFPAMLLVKSTITMLVLLVLVPFARLWRRNREFVFLVIPAVTFLLMAMSSRLNMGVRHILPMYPFCIILAAAAGWELARRSSAMKIGLALLVLYAVVSTLHAYPDYLAYSNEAFGGPANTYRMVTDSNADWGQGFKWTKRYLDQNHITDCWFDTGSPFVNPQYYGINCKPLPGAWALFGIGPSVPVPSTITGTILISGTELEGILWGPDVLNPYEQFQHLRPEAEPGNVVMAYRGTFHVPLLSAYSQAAGAVGLMRMGRMPEAIAAAQAAAKQAPDSAEIQAVLGQALMVSGQRAQAQQAFGSAIHLGQTIHPEFQKAFLSMLLHPPGQ